MALTVDFAAAVRRQGSITAQSTDADILAAGDMEIQARFLPMLREAGAEFGLRRVTLPIVNGRPAVPPDRAQISGVRLVQYVVNGVVSVLPQMQPEDDLGSAILGTQPIGCEAGCGGAGQSWVLTAPGDSPPNALRSIGGPSVTRMSATSESTSRAPRSLTIGSLRIFSSESRISRG